MSATSSRRIVAIISLVTSTPLVVHSSLAFAIVASSPTVKTVGRPRRLTIRPVRSHFSLTIMFSGTRTPQI